MGGVAVATLVVKLIPVDWGADGFAALSVLATVAGGLLGGFLAPPRNIVMGQCLQTWVDETAAAGAGQVPHVGARHCAGRCR